MAFASGTSGSLSVNRGTLPVLAPPPQGSEPRILLRSFARPYVPTAGVRPAALGHRNARPPVENSMENVSETNGTNPSSESEQEEMMQEKAFELVASLLLNDMIMDNIRDNE
ncbi:hypothetical protein [Salipiger pallidus]|nr:hypothetical protein [Salipiger pallidus]